MPNPTFQKLIDDLETAVGAWENNLTSPCCRGPEGVFYWNLRLTLDDYYAEMARR